MLRSVILAAALMSGGVATGAAAQSAADALRDRKAGFQNNAAQMRAIKAIVDNKSAVGPVVQAAQSMNDFSKKLVALFPAGSGTGDTKALPAIWSDNAGFATAAANFDQATARLQQAAASGNANAVAQAFQAVGATCGGCHEKYRAR
jgi:cytochrome c556